jgi:hypothetical protein
MRGWICILFVDAILQTTRGARLNAWHAGCSREGEENSGDRPPPLSRGRRGRVGRSSRKNRRSCAY